MPALYYRLTLDCKPNLCDGCGMLLLGLGNPQQYAGTRHNIGREMLIAATERITGTPFSLWEFDRLLHAHYLPWEDARLGSHIAAVPETFMNRSGTAARALCGRFAIPPVGVLLIHDDLDVPFGQLRFAFARGDGGHQGVRDVQKQLGSTDEYRLRIGIAPKDPRRRPQGKEAVSHFVLAPFAKEEATCIPQLQKAVTEALTTFLTHGLEHAANVYNGKDLCA